MLFFTYCFIIVSETSIQNSNGGDPARNAHKMRAHIQGFQAAFTAIEKCSKPVIAAVHSACFGAGVDLVTACDIRYCAKDSFFCVKEVDVGLAADVGSLQRLPKVIGNNSLVRELCLTGRK
jgi:delta(3,5)-delta(2,4)-dienoyl-CoA isomerase